MDDRLTCSSSPPPPRLLTDPSLHAAPPPLQPPWRQRWLATWYKFLSNDLPHDGNYRACLAATAWRVMRRKPRPDHLAFGAKWVQSVSGRIQRKFNFGKINYALWRGVFHWFIQGRISTMTSITSSRYMLFGIQYIRDIQFCSVKIWGKLLIIGWSTT